MLSSDAATQAKEFRMSEPSDSRPRQDYTAEAMQLIEKIEQELSEGNLYPVSRDTVQSLMGMACRLYGAHRTNGETYLPVGGHNAITSTDAVLACSGLLDAADLSAFEFGMWKNYNGG
jgi:hypothetical protein